MSESTLAQLLRSELERQGESTDDLQAVQVSDATRLEPTKCADVSFNDLEHYSGDTGYGGESLPRLRAYTPSRVYFKHVYDGWESVQSLPRSPTNEDVRRVG